MARIMSCKSNSRSDRGELSDVAVKGKPFLRTVLLTDCQEDGLPGLRDNDVYLARSVASLSHYVTRAYRRNCFSHNPVGMMERFKPTQSATTERLQPGLELSAGI